VCEGSKYYSSLSNNFESLVESFLLFSCLLLQSLWNRYGILVLFVLFGLIGLDKGAGW
jgi:hypothetical protein